ANQACAACILTRPSDPAWGPVIVNAGFELNSSGCMALMDPTSQMCAKAVQAEVECEDQACKDNCPVTNDTTQAAFQVCTDQAAMTGCQTFKKAADCSMTFINSAGSCFPLVGTKFQDLYKTIATLFCGGTASDGGSSDASAPHDGGPTDATTGG